ncbi:MAG TPA: superoxide dismutase, Ni [Dehalococcoidia bacterium]|nr:superoxide dismutase, Ni [Dehalococcoidia bacterium]
MTLSLTRRLRPARTAHAHCDIPCGIYDPHEAEIAAETVEKMVSLLNDLGADDGSLAWRNSATRYITSKEEHAEKVKRQVLIIWGDFVKPPHVEKFPDIHDKVWNLVKLAGANKVNADAELAANLRAGVKDFADTFWEMKKG